MRPCLRILDFSYFMPSFVPIEEWLRSSEINTATRTQILDDAVDISYTTSNLRKCMNPTILPLAMGK